MTQVFFPDVERCEWLNKILKQVWPSANDYARGMIKDTIEPNVATALAGYKMNNFRFDRIILGTVVSFETLSHIGGLASCCFHYRLSNHPPVGVQ